jgi:hypothetical protein
MTEDGLISFNFMGGDPEILEVKHPFNDRKVALYYQLDGTLRQQNSKKGIYILRREDGKMIKFVK